MGFQSFLVENKKTSLCLFVLLIYFMWMDITLYHHIQATSPSKISSTINSSDVKSFRSKNIQPTAYSPFNGLTVKLMMLNHPSHFVYLPVGMAFEQITRFSARFAFITPNMISSFHLMMAILSAKLVTSDSIFVRQIAVLLFEFRTFLDSLDGIVARARIHQVENISNFGSFGHFVDGVTDTLGTIAFMIGSLCFLKGQNLAKIAYNLLPAWTNEVSVANIKANGCITNGIANTKPIQIASATNRRICFVWGCFCVQVIISALLWERYVSGYYQLLESQPTTVEQALLQNQILKSSLMWIIIFFWKLSNALALVELFLLFVFVDKMWEFLTWIQYVGFFSLIGLALVTETHYYYAKTYIGIVS